MNVNLREYQVSAMMRSILLVISMWAVVVQPIRRVDKFCLGNESPCIFIDKKCLEDCAKQATIAHPSLKVFEEPIASASSANHYKGTELHEDSESSTLNDQYDGRPDLEMLDPNVLDDILASDEISDLSMHDAVDSNFNPVTGNYPSRRSQRIRRTPRRISLQPYKKPYSKSLIPPSSEAPPTTLPPVRVTTLPPHVGFSYGGKLFDKLCKPICEYNGQYFPHPVVCSKFYHCAGSTPYEIDCPQTTSYDTDSGVCQHVYDAINDVCDSFRDCSGEGY